MERTLEGLRQPHRYVLDEAQLHIYMLMKKVSEGGRRVPARLPDPSCRRAYTCRLRSCGPTERSACDFSKYCNVEDSRCKVDTVTW